MSLPKDFENLAETGTVKYSAVENTHEQLYGVQFHPEAYHTEYGLDVLKNFAEIRAKKN